MGIAVTLLEFFPGKIGNRLKPARLYQTMDNTLPVIYVSVLLSLLASITWLVIRQVFKTRKVENSLTRIQNKLQTELGTVQEYYELGSIYSDKKLFAQASKLFQKALKAQDAEEEKLAPIYNALGYAYFAQEQYDLAIRQYKEALKENPEYVTAWNNLAHTYERKQLAAQALEAYETVLKLEPKNDTAKRRAESLRKRFAPSK